MRFFANFEKSLLRIIEQKFKNGIPHRRGKATVSFRSRESERKSRTEETDSSRREAMHNVWNDRYDGDWAK